MLKRAMYLVMMLTVLASSPYAFAADLSAAPAPACGPLCQQYKLAHPTTLRPATVSLACINFWQAGTDNVVLTFRRPDGSVIRELAKTASAQNRFCFNRQLLWAASIIMLCDGANTVIIHDEQMTVLRQQGGMTPTQYACLLGRTCKNYRGHIVPQFADAGSR